MVVLSQFHVPSQTGATCLWSTKCVTGWGNRGVGQRHRNGHQRLRKLVKIKYLAQKALVPPDNFELWRVKCGRSTLRLYTGRRKRNAETEGVFTDRAANCGGHH